jgi:hypothetical protein
MNHSRQDILYSASGRVPWLIATVLLVLLLAATIMLSRAFEQAEERDIARYFDSITTHIETDLLNSANHHGAIQSRMATRLAFDGPFDQAAWQSDAAALMADHPYYKTLAVLEGDFTVRWIQGEAGEGIGVGKVFPLSTGTRARLAQQSARAGTVALEPLGMATSDPALLFMTPVMAHDEIVNWLAAVVQVPASIRAMLTGFYLRDVTLSGDFAGVKFAIPGPEVEEPSNPAYRRALNFQLGDNHSGLMIDVALRPRAVEQMRSALPQFILVFGGLIAVALVIAALLAMAAARQARVLSLANQNLKSEIRDRELAERQAAAPDSGSAHARTRG